MIKKQLKLILSFENTESAMAMEDMCREKNLPGRIIPVPTEITAGCGLAWMAQTGDKEVLLQASKDAGIPVQNTYELMI